MSKKQDAYYFQNFIACADYSCQAAHLLRETDSPIQEIASYIGMPDNNYFSRCFRMRYGVSPTAYRHGGNAL